MGWLDFTGDNGINSIFDVETNKRKGHYRDDALIPFKTKGDNNKYEDFSGVVGAFSRLMSDTALKGGVDMQLLRNEMKNKVDVRDDDEFNVLFHIVEELYFSDGKLLPTNIKSLSYVHSNITQQQVAEYLYSLFVDGTDLRDQYLLMSAKEETNVLENLVFSSLEDTEKSKDTSFQKADCLLPYVKEVFIKDLKVLMRDNDIYKTYISRFLAYYYLFYVSQLAVKLSKFEKGQRNEIEKIFFSVNWEIVTRVRPGYEYGWKYVKEAISHMFSHSVVLEMMSRNLENKHFDYIGIYNRMLGTDDDETAAKEINEVCSTYKQWIPLDYSKCKHDSRKDGVCQASNAVRSLYETVDYQFINGGRASHYRGYNKKFIDFAQKNFGKWGGTSGYIMAVNENDIVMFTKIILDENDGKIRLSKLFTEFEKRGLLFDRESKKKITILYEKMNLLEKRSDSGDAQYVKSIL